MADVKKSCVFYADWMDAAHSIDDMKLRCTFYECILQYAITGMEIDVPQELKLTMALVTKQIDRDRADYERKCEKNRENIKKRYERLRSNTNEYERTESNKVVCDNDNVNDNGNDNENDTDESKDSNINNTPLPPFRGQGGGAKSFNDFFERVKTVAVPKAVMDVQYEKQYIWRIVEGNPGYGLAVKQAINAYKDPTELQTAIQRANEKYKPQGDFARLNLAMAMMKLKTAAQVQAVVEEYGRAEREPGIYKTLLGKVEYINGGNRVGNLAAFMKSRTKA